MNLQNAKILLIDDNPKNLQVAMSILAQEGYNLIYAQDGRKGLSLTEENDFDLILLDVVMPEIDGYSVAKSLKSNPKTKDIPIIFLTVKDEEKDIIHGFECGGVDYVTKPFFTSVLLKRVETHLKLFKTTKALKQLNEKLHEEVIRQVEKIRLKDQILSQQSKMASIGEMIANIAHQWRQPLGAVNAAVINVRSKFALDYFDLETSQGRKECKDFLDKTFKDIDEYVQFLSATIDDFRNFFKPQKEESLYDISEVVQRSIKLLKANFQDSQIEVIDHSAHIKLYGYGNELAQALINLLNNAKDALENQQNDERKLIIVSTKEEDGNIVLSVQDSGGGIPEEIVNKIFEPYFTTKHSSQGTGIGLYMTQEIVKHMGGKVNVKNKTFIYDGQSYFGAYFEIVIPSGSN